MSKNSNKSEVTGQATSATKKQNLLARPEDYPSSSQIARAYSAGCFPNFTHQRLFQALLKVLDGKSEGNVDFGKVLEEAQMHRSSALQILRHMSNFKILEVAFNSSHVVGEARKSWAFVKILNNLEADDSSKSHQQS